MTPDERNKEMPHTVILEGREKLSISGVIDVQSFDEEQVLLETVRGMLVEYDDSVQPRGGLLGRLFGR